MPDKGHPTTPFLPHPIRSKGAWIPGKGFDFWTLLNHLFTKKRPLPHQRLTSRCHDLSRNRNTTMKNIHLIAILLAGTATPILA